MTSRLPEAVVIIPARGGSKGVPRKNIQLLAGKPLLAHTIEQARRSGVASRVVVSTDDEEIAAVARDYGAELIRRPAEISGDAATSESALLHALDTFEAEGYRPELIVFLQCTSPIRRPEEIARAVRTLHDEEADSLLSVVPFHLFLWERVDGHARPLDYDPRRRPRRQEKRPEYVENGSIYVFKPWVLREQRSRLGGRIALFVMDEWSALDINTPRDLELGEWLLSRPSRSGS